MAKMTITEAFDFPLRLLKPKLKPHDSPEPLSLAAGILRMEPARTEKVEYRVALPAGAVVPSSFAEAVGQGVALFAEGNDAGDAIVGIRVTLTALKAGVAYLDEALLVNAGAYAMQEALRVHRVFANPVTITETLDIPFLYRACCRYASGMLRLEPIPTQALEYRVAVVGEPSGESMFIENGEALYFSEAVGAGVLQAAERHGLVGVRVTLTKIVAHAIDSNEFTFLMAASIAIQSAINRHGVPISG